MKSRFLPLFLALNLTASAEDAKQPTTFFRTLGVNLEVRELGFLKDDRFTPVTVDIDTRSIRYELEPQQAQIVFGKQEPGEDGALQFKEKAKLELPNRGARWLILFFSKTGKPDSWSTMLLNEDAASVPAGGYRVVNLMENPVGILLGDEKKIVEPGETSVLEARPKENKIVFKAQVYRFPGNPPVAAYSSIWAIDRDQRHLVLISPSEATPTGVEVKRLPEYTAVASVGNQDPANP